MSLDLTTLLSTATPEQKAEALRLLKGQVRHWVNAILDDEMATATIDQKISEFIDLRNGAHEEFHIRRKTPHDGGEQKMDMDDAIKKALMPEERE